MRFAGAVSSACTGNTRPERAWHTARTLPQGRGGPTRAALLGGWPTLRVSPARPAHVGVGARPLCEVQTRACAPLPAMFYLQIRAEWAGETTKRVSVHEGCVRESVPGAPVERKGITGAREPLAAAGERHRSLTAGEAVARQSHLAVFPADPRRRIYAPRGVELTAARAVSMRRAVARGGCHPGLRHTGQCDTPRGGGVTLTGGHPANPPLLHPYGRRPTRCLAQGG